MIQSVCMNSLCVPSPGSLITTMNFINRVITGRSQKRARIRALDSVHMWRLLVVVACLPVASVAFAPSATVHLGAPRSALLPRSAALSMHARAANLQPQRLELAAATVAQPAAAWMRAASRFALALATVLLTLTLHAGRAFAVTAAKRARKAVAPSAVESLLTGNTLKWAVCGTVLGAMFVFRREEQPLLTETVIHEEPVARPAQSARDNASNQPAEGLLPVSFDVDDSSIHSAMLKRMQQLAREQGEAAAKPETPPPAPPADATRGGLGMLERPSEEGGLLDGEPPVTFPPGFPLVNNFEEDFDAKPAASEEQIAMLKRMFGGA